MPLMMSKVEQGVQDIRECAHEDPALLIEASSVHEDEFFKMQRRTFVVTDC